MNVIDISNRFKSNSKIEGREILISLNERNQTMNIYLCLFMGDIKFRIRKVKDNSLIGEFDSKLNLLGGLKAVVDIEELGKAMEDLNKVKISLDSTNELFGFDKIVHLLK